MRTLWAALVPLAEARAPDRRCSTTYSLASFCVSWSLKLIWCSRGSWDLWKVMLSVALATLVVYLRSCWTYAGLTYSASKVW